MKLSSKKLVLPSISVDNYKITYLYKSGTYKKIYRNLKDGTTYTKKEPCHYLVSTFEEAIEAIPFKMGIKLKELFAKDYCKEHNIPVPK